VQTKEVLIVVLSCLHVLIVQRDFIVICLYFHIMCFDQIHPCSLYYSILSPLLPLFFQPLVGFVVLFSYMQIKSSDHIHPSITLSFCPVLSSQFSPNRTLQQSLFCIPVTFLVLDSTRERTQIVLLLKYSNP
jgi:hypothetical protein